MKPLSLAQKALKLVITAGEWDTAFDNDGHSCRTCGVYIPQGEVLRHHPICARGELFEELRIKQNKKLCEGLSKLEGAPSKEQR